MELGFDLDALETPYYIVDENLLIKNLKVLKSVIDKTDCKILLAQKAFSMYSLYPLIGKYLNGTTASGLYEARLGYEEMGRETHVFSPVFFEKEFDEILSICDHVVFNSFSQWEKYKEKCLKTKKKFGIRINPEYSTQQHSLYDPCAEGSRLGVTIQNFNPNQMDGISGFHFHTLCEQNADDLAKTLEVIEEKFSKYFNKIEWINFGGGHHITRSDYDLNTLITWIQYFKNRYHLQVYLEPGEAVVLNTGYLVCTVVDVMQNNNIYNAILDTSAACHMPDVLEMPYRPKIVNAGMPSEKKYTYRLGGPTCLAGDIIGDYSFDYPLKSGDKLVFCDMAHYTMVKNNTFNGMKLPSIAVADKNHQVKLIRDFDYKQFKERL